MSHCLVNTEHKEKYKYKLIRLKQLKFKGKENFGVENNMD